MTAGVRVLVLGATGQVGAELLCSPTPPNWTLLHPDRQTLDLSDPSSVSSALKALRPDAIINAAAYTAVDQAESDQDIAFTLNCDAPAALAQAAAGLGACLVHLSTDYVFDGEKPTPYVETDEVRPLNVYGRSKAEGEYGVLSACPRSAVLRTSWVYSPHRSNFVRTMLRLAEIRSEVRVVGDQHGRPTAARDVAAACISMTGKLLTGDENARGVFHYAGAGDASWADLADAVFEKALDYGRHPVKVQRITTAEYPTRARRPANSRLDSTKIEALGIPTRPWLDGVRDCVSALLAAN